MEMADYILQTGGKIQTVDLLSLYGAIHYSIMEMVTWFTSIVYSLQPAFYHWSALCILPPVRSMWLSVHDLLTEGEECKQIYQWKIIYLNCLERCNLDMTDHCSYVHNLSSFENKG